MPIVGGLDIHRRQITFDWMDTDTGECERGQIRPAVRTQLQQCLNDLPRHQGAFALEGTTGWRFVVEELERGGFEAHLAEPADTKALRGRKRRAKTDRADARHLRELLGEGRLPESWIPPAHLQDLRSLSRLRKAIVEERSAWVHRISAVVFHHGLPAGHNPLRASGRAWLEGTEVPPVARRTITLALEVIDDLDTRLRPLQGELTGVARRQPGCLALQRHWGIGPITSLAILTELGDTRRFGSSRHAVRFCGLDITISESDTKRSRGRLSRQGAPVLRWALFEAAKRAAHPASPDHTYYCSARERLGSKRATLSVARKLARWSHHVLRELGDEAFAPA